MLTIGATQPCEHDARARHGAPTATRATVEALTVLSPSPRAGEGGRSPGDERETARCNHTVVLGGPDLRGVRMRAFVEEAPCAPKSRPSLMASPSEVSLSLSRSTAWSSTAE